MLVDMPYKASADTYLYFNTHSPLNKLAYQLTFHNQDGLFVCGDDLDATKGIGSNFTIPDECHFSPSRTTVKGLWPIFFSLHFIPEISGVNFDLKYCRISRMRSNHTSGHTVGDDLYDLCELLRSNCWTVCQTSSADSS